MKLIATLSLIVITFTILSCSKKQDQDNPVTPVNNAITLTGINNADSLKGTVSAQIAATGNQPQKIEVFANDSLIASATKAPYNLQWNTLGVVNGTYKIKTVATYDGGKQVEVSLNVVVKNILMTLETDPKVNSIYTNVMYIVTDSAGNLLNNIKYNGTDRIIEVAASHPYIKNRFSVFEVKTDINSQTFITGYMSIPRGSTWNLRGISENLNPVLSGANINFTNTPVFNRMTISSDLFGRTYTALPVTISYYGTSPTGKLLVQYVDNSSNGYYGFFNIDTTKSSTTMSLRDSIFKASIKQTASVSGGATDVNFNIYGKSDKNYDSFYVIDNGFYQGGNFTYFYPDGNYLTDFKSQVYYHQNGWTYSYTYKSLIPQAIAPFGTTANISNKTLNGFSFTAQGNLDYYSVNFNNTPAKAYIKIYSTSAYRSFQFPDILKLTNLSAVSLADFKISSFSLFKTTGFDEKKLFYYDNDFPSISVESQTAIQYFQ
jgi:hypothetical protein